MEVIFHKNQLFLQLHRNKKEIPYMCVSAHLYVRVHLHKYEYVCVYLNISCISPVCKMFNHNVELYF